MRRYIAILWPKLKIFLRNFNLFPSIPPTTDEHQLRNERISTRLFILILILCLAILILYTSLVNITQTVNVKPVSITKYSRLYSLYPQTLTCPCTKISINYDKLLQINYTLHQLCYSVFVSESWIDYFSTYKLYYNSWYDDFRSTGTPIFQGLNTLCMLVNQTISNRLIQFYSIQYITASVIPLEVFQSQMNASISQFKSTITDDFHVSLNTIRDTTQTNALFTGEQTNYRLIAYGVTYLYSQPVMYGNCSCMSSATCAYQAGIYDVVNRTLLFAISGIYSGCYVLESLLQSDLRCFYNQTCINKLQSYLYSLSPINITALDRSLSNHFFENSTIAEVLDDLMVEEWNPSTMYDSYYNECQPIECSYTHQTKNSVIYIVTTIVGLIGGLVTVLKFIIPRFIKFIIFCIRKCKQRRTKVLSIIQT